MHTAKGIVYRSYFFQTNFQCFGNFFLLLTCSALFYYRLWQRYDFHHTGLVNYKEFLHRLGVAVSNQFKPLPDSAKGGKHSTDCMVNGYLMPLSTIFQSYRDCQFYLEAHGVILENCQPFGNNQHLLSHKVVSSTPHHG